MHYHPQLLTALGYGDGLNHEYPQLGDTLPYVDFGSSVGSALRIYARNGITCAIFSGVQSSQRILKCWGDDYNNSGLLANSAIINNSYQSQAIGATPESMISMAAIQLGTNEDVQDLALGDYYICSQLASARIKCWGWNRHGELGSGVADQYLGKQSSTMGDQLPALAIE
jgi:hypothetical protein